MINLPEKDLTLIKKILQIVVPDLPVYAYGSRVKDKAEKFSDLDLVIKGNESVAFSVIDQIKDQFSISDLPILVDVSDWHQLSESFQQAIQAELVKIQ